MANATWRMKKDYISWSWLLPLPPAEGNDWLVELFSRIRDSLGDFGHASRALLELMQGDDLRFELPAQWDAFFAALGELKALQIIYLHVDLRCRTANEEEFIIPNGGTFCLSLGREVEGVNPTDDQRQLLFWLNTDIYDPDSFEGPNEATAAQNAPRLASFLRRIEELPVEFHSLDTFAPGAHRYGFTVEP